MIESMEFQSERHCIRIQAISGLVFGLFVAVHLGNSLLALSGSSIYDGFQRNVQAIYQHPIVEILLLGFVLPLHITAGIVRARDRRQRGESQPTTIVRIHRYAGWFLVVVVYWHAAAVRLPSLLYGVWPRFDGVAFSIEWMPMWFYPYYFLLAWAGFFHMLNGTGIALMRLGITRRALGAPQLRALGFMAALLITVSLLAFGGVWFDVGTPMDSDYTRLYLSLMEKFLK